MMVLPKHVTASRDRHGKMRYRFRRQGFSRYVPAPGTDDFWDEYRRCLDERFVPAAKEVTPTWPERSLLLQLDIQVTCHGLDRTGPYLYFIEAENGLIKIGHSCSLRERFKKIQTAAPLSLKLLGLRRGTAADEAELHRRFAADRVRGEWFRSSPKLREIAEGKKVNNDEPF